MQYNLVMKMSHNNYQPFDFNLLANYKGENLYSLKGIDDFTAKYNSEEELKEELCEANFIDEIDKNNEMKIIFYENQGIREHKYPLCFAASLEYLNSDTIISFIENNCENSKVMNKLYNEFNKRREKSDYWPFVLDVLKNIHVAQNLKNIQFIHLLPYEEKRSLGMFIYHTFDDIIYSESKGVKNGVKRLRVNA